MNVSQTSTSVSIRTLKNGNDVHIDQTGANRFSVSMRDNKGKAIGRIDHYASLEDATALSDLMVSMWDHSHAWQSLNAMANTTSEAYALACKNVRDQLAHVHSLPYPKPVSWSTEHD